MKKLAVVAAFLAVAQMGCATILSGTSDKVQIDCEPVGSTCVVIGEGGIGGLLVTATQANVGLRKILEMVAPHMSPEARETLKKVDFNDLVASLVMWARLDQAPPDFVAGFGTLIKSLPKALVEDILDALGLKEFGISPFTVKLKKGKMWGVLCFKEGYKARIDLVGLRFNAVTLLNALNLFLGCFVDLATGAMFNLEEKTRIKLKKRE
ncbi:MAG: hypothetical protein HYY16_14240 [Planctomycetes bacterium]|nr:hypothetical protein [Planctomycetota bacterium]